MPIIPGSFMPVSDNSDPTQDGIQVQMDAFGNARRADGQDGRSDIASLNRDDVFYGSQNPATLGDKFTTGSDTRDIERAGGTR